MIERSGAKAEQVASDYLKSLGYKILDRNWRTRYCEIDIVAQKSDTAYFVEVKYRAKDSWGAGLDYITPQKLKQMQFAAELWVAKNRFKGDYNLAAIEVSGVDFKVTNWLDSV